MSLYSRAVLGVGKCVVGFGSYDGTRRPHFQVPGGCVNLGFTLQPSVFFESPCCVLWVLRGLSVVVFYGPRGACTMGLASAAVCVVGISLSCFGGPRSLSEAVFYGLRGDRKMGLHCSRSAGGVTSVVITLGALTCANFRVPGRLQNGVYL